MQFNHERKFNMRRIAENNTGKTLTPSINVTATGKNIKKALDLNHISNKRIASDLFVSVQAVSAWKNGKYIPDIENLKYLSMETGVSIDDLLEFDMI